MTNKIKKELNDFIIILKPILQPDNKTWTGSVFTTIISSEKSQMNQTDRDDIYHMCKLMCNSMALVNEYPEFRIALEDYTQNTNNFLDIEEKNDINKVVSKNDNIIKLDFSTKPKGNA